jgi:pimeloyl-ACP methyl ester carboxylesterase
MRIQRYFAFPTDFLPLGRRWSIVFATAAALLSGAGMLQPADVLAQAKTAKSTKATKTQDEENELPPAEDLILMTGDGLKLAATYFPGTKGKETVPVVLLHAWKQNRTDYKELATLLQAQGHAVLMPDLRGHGESTKLTTARGEETLKAAAMPPLQFGAMVTRDMAAVKTFLWEKNNARELNIDKLCVVGAEMGAVVALNFAIADALDQDQNRVFQPDYQLGRFVKALVLISPELAFHGLVIRANSARLIPNVSMLILVGKKDGKALEEADRIHGIFARYHPEPTGDDRIDRQTLFFGKLDTLLQGAKLLDPKFNVGPLIVDFIYRRLIKSDESKEWSWRARKLPHE